jgi:hypothetical protein
MKAWIVYYGDEWCTLVHADTRGKAKAQAINNVFEGDGFTEFSANRLPGLDDKPITYQNAKEAGFEYRDDWDGNPLKAAEFINDCRCDICLSHKE